MSSILDLAASFNEQCRQAATKKRSRAGNSLVGFRPVHSEALAVHPDQVPEAMQAARAHGFNLNFDSEARPVFESSRQMRAYAKRMGFRHKGY